jgi:hypothetical protein
LVAAVAHSKSAKTSSLALVFDSAECAGRQVKSLPLTILAVLAPEQGSALNATAPLNEAIGVDIAGGSRTEGPGGMRSVTTAAATANMQLSGQEGPAAITPGSVVGLRGLKLSVGTGPEGSSVVSATGQDVRLERGYRFFLGSAVTAPTEGATAKTAATPTSPSASPSLNAAPQPSTAVSNAAADETETCSPPYCSIVLPDSSSAAPSAEASVSIGELGYAPRVNRQAYEFDHESAIAFLDVGQLLFAFNSHSLVERNTAEGSPRIIRALLVDLTTMRVTRALDWRVPDDKQFLWQSHENRVIVHVADELRVYGPGLKLEHKTRLNGPVAFLRTSPSGRTIVLGIVHERHSPEMHRQLESALEGPPEEDVEVMLMDDRLQLMSSWLHSGNVAAPVLSNNGELRLLSSSSEAYRIVEYGWNKQRLNVASIISACTPNLASVSPNLIFVSGCARVTKEKWCRVLRPDGQPILKTSCSFPEIMQYASGSEGGQSFALGVVEATRSMIPGASFKANDLSEGRIAIYRTLDGKRLARIRFSSPAGTEQIFALSPDGRRLAVLSGNRILFYGIESAIGPDRATSKIGN